jgi:hypothetical protein
MEKPLNFNEIETEQLFDKLNSLDDDVSDEVDILDFCLDLDNNEVIDDEKFNLSWRLSKIVKLENIYDLIVLKRQKTT